MDSLGISMFVQVEDVGEEEVHVKYLRQQGSYYCWPIVDNFDWVHLSFK